MKMTHPITRSWHRKGMEVLMVVALLSMVACSSGNSNEVEGNTSAVENSTENNTEVNGKSHGILTKENFTEGSVLVVMDTSVWNTAIGDSVRRIFMQATYGLPQPEPYFNVTRIDPGDFKGTFKKFYNIIVVGNVNSSSHSTPYLRGLLGKKNVEKARNEKPGAAPFHVSSDVFIKGQNIVYLLATSDEELKKKLSDHRDQIAAYFDHKVAGMLSDRQSYEKFNGAYRDSVQKYLGATFYVPKGYLFAKAADNFIWFRIPDERIDKNIVISKVPYTSQDQFSDESLNKWRDSLGANWIKVEGDTSHYVVTQRYMPLKGEVTTINGNYAKLCRGLWSLKDNSLGGPFVSYAMVSKDKQSIYYIEGFIAAVGQNKRKLIRDMRAVISNLDG